VGKTAKIQSSMYRLCTRREIIEYAFRRGQVLQIRLVGSALLVEVTFVERIPENKGVVVFYNHSNHTLTWSQITEILYL
jgi:hypothetical protein